MVGWEKPVTRYNKNNNNNNNKNLHCHMHKECSTYVCWRSRMAKQEREEELVARWHLCSLSLASLLLRSLIHSIVTVQQSLPI